MDRLAARWAFELVAAQTDFDVLLNAKTVSDAERILEEHSKKLTASTNATSVAISFVGSAIGSGKALFQDPIGTAARSHFVAQREEFLRRLAAELDLSPRLAAQNWRRSVALTLVDGLKS
jgi:hypothetical protein